MENRWIPVTERMPRSGIRVLVCDGLGDIDIMYRSSTLHGWAYDDGIFTDSMFKDLEAGIKAWMPLPEPYKEES